MKILSKYLFLMIFSANSIIYAAPVDGTMELSKQDETRFKQWNQHYWNLIKKNPESLIPERKTQSLKNLKNCSTVKKSELFEMQAPETPLSVLTTDYEKTSHPEIQKFKAKEIIEDRCDLEAYWGNIESDFHKNNGIPSAPSHPCIDRVEIKLGAAWLSTDKTQVFIRQSHTLFETFHAAWMDTEEKGVEKIVWDKTGIRETLISRCDF
ncbi:MAG: hypothetical protein CL678_16940 [Bdellovibrionaceae bacterium]|nr:hypothetical protein [Pseudobdellovibrionaceae bacterium]|tara:strand:- start:2190 stop:2816 length:627 start_codon:yes stop_codon:yes gene_type:complete